MKKEYSRTTEPVDQLYYSFKVFFPAKGCWVKGYIIMIYGLRWDRNTLKQLNQLISYITPSKY